jgi:hypothetical protein
MCEFQESLATYLGRAEQARLKSPRRYPAKITKTLRGFTRAINPEHRSNRSLYEALFGDRGIIPCYRRLRQRCSQDRRDQPAAVSTCNDARGREGPRNILVHVSGREEAPSFWSGLVRK